MQKSSAIRARIPESLKQAFEAAGRLRTFLG
jgi:hypothetical protein